LKDYNVEYAKLPKISITDPSIDNLEVKLGDVIKISRKSSTSGNTVYYRMVIEQ
jgi:DNA-directed RNA polymerase subunit H